MKPEAEFFRNSAELQPVNEVSLSLMPFSLLSFLKSCGFELSYGTLTKLFMYMILHDRNVSK